MTLANEERQVKAIAVAPGIVDTDMQVNIRENVGPSSMSAEQLKMFRGLKENNQLLDSSVPATVYAKLALHGIPDGVNGQYLSYNDPALADFMP
ncbi:hypothetical protein NW754_016723 [Fusarium falciforme]|nr:hypothetical protein NW754_016723 [Fusarium falciforme]